MQSVWSRTRTGGERIKNPGVTNSSVTAGELRPYTLDIGNVRAVVGNCNHGFHLNPFHAAHATSSTSAAPAT